LRRHGRATETQDVMPPDAHLRLRHSWLCVAAVFAAMPVLACSDSTGTDMRLPDPSLELAAGFYQTCLLRMNGRIVCWGAWQGGQGSATTTPTVVDTGTPATPFAAIGAGGHTCGLTQSGEA
jgi:hypothetical protein